MIFAANVFPALTGDESNAAMFIVIAVIAVIVVLVLAFKDRIFRTGFIAMMQTVRRPWR